MEEIALLEEQRQRDRVSLNKNERQSQNEAFDRAQLAIINKRRELENQPPFKTIQDWEDFQETQTDEDRDITDFIVEESAEVLLDFVDLQTQMATASAA